jgi:apolipoprotein N-acyltransferase
VSSYVNKGADAIFIMTNDGWWEDTPGYRQHLAYARIRAIENRRSIARSANTGSSAFINQRGDLIAPTGWWEAISIKADIHLNKTKTYYTENGDYIGRIAGFVGVLMLLWSWRLKFMPKRN